AGRDNEVLIAEPGAQQLRWIDVTRHAEHCRPAQPPGSGSGTGSQPGPGEPDGHGTGSTCCCPQQGPSRKRPQPPEHRPGSRDPEGGCIPGNDGEPEGCIITFVRNGEVFTVNRCVPGGGACHARLRFRAERVTRTPRTVVATSRNGRRLAILDGTTLDALY